VSCFLGQCARGDRYAETAALAFAVVLIAMLAASKPPGMAAVGVVRWHCRGRGRLRLPRLPRTGRCGRQRLVSDGDGVGRGRHHRRAHRARGTGRAPIWQRLRRAGSAPSLRHASTSVGGAKPTSPPAGEPWAQPPELPLLGPRQPLDLSPSLPLGWRAGGVLRADAANVLASPPVWRSGGMGLPPLLGRPGQVHRGGRARRGVE
jgi:hypothetical protein